tara:strand:+ start:865 stop:1566 length:702 start_codon:yes stop_codon:yes gene_type:complete
MRKYYKIIIKQIVDLYNNLYYDNIQTKIIMGTFAGPDIVTDGLVLSLDAASTRSYPGTGTTWYDLSGNGNDHTIVNAPTFANGAFTLDQTQGFTLNSMPTLSTTASIVIFYKTTDQQELWLRGNNGNYYVAASNNNGDYYNGSVGSPSYFVDTLATINPNTPIDYRNGEYHMWEAKNCNFVIAATDWNQLAWFLYGSDWNINGTVAKIMMYDRALTAAESKQNFNAFKSRFDI